MAEHQAWLAPVGRVEEGLGLKERSPEVVEPDDLQAVDFLGLVPEHANPEIGQTDAESLRCFDVLPAVAVVVVAEDREAPERPRAEVFEHPQRLVHEFGGLVVEDVARDDSEMLAEPGDELDRVDQVVGIDHRADVRDLSFLPEGSAELVYASHVLEYFDRAGIDLKPEHEVHNVVHAISMITSTRAVMMLPAYTQRYLPESIATRPVKGEAPTVDLVIAHHRANRSPIVKLLLSNIGKFITTAS